LREPWGKGPGYPAFIVKKVYQVGDRPDRVEPRARKRRPKDYPNLHRPRQEARRFRYAKS